LVTVIVAPCRGFSVATTCPVTIVFSWAFEGTAPSNANNVNRQGMQAKNRFKEGVLDKTF